MKLEVGLGRSKGSSRWVLGLIGLGLFTAMLFTILLVWKLISDLERQRSASSDNMQWTLTQVEVEHLSFLNALEHYLHPPDAHDEPPDLYQIRRHFDVFYSRVDTLKSAGRFTELRQSPEFSDALASVLAYLEENVAFIDSADDILASEIAPLLERTSAIRPDIRELALGGLTFFAQQGDARRAQTTRTLTQLAGFTSVLFIVLAAASIYLLFVNRVIRKGSEELADANQRISTVLSTALDAVVVSNKSGEVVEFNTAAEKVFGYSVAEAIGKTVGELIVPVHLQDAHQTGMERMQRGGARHIMGQGPVQLEAKRKNGEVFPVELLLQSAKDGQEEIVIGFIRDISKQVSDEQELIDARDKALAGQKAKDDFLTVMSHEIRTPLNGILGNLALLEKSDLNEEQRQFTRNMEISSEVMLSHVNSVLDIARFEAGKLQLEAETVNLSEMLQDIVDGQSSYAARNGNMLRWQWVGEPGPWVEADGQRLRQILLNLVGNAIKFTRNGKVLIEVEVSGKNPKTATSIFEFRVIDTGAGIEQSSLDAIFDDFFTMDTSLDRPSDGTGLGLGIAQRLVQSMDGEIGVESEPGEGSVFWLRVSLPQSEAIEQERVNARHQTAVGVLDVLVVEDNEINMLVLKNILEQEGHRVTTAENGKAGVELASAHAYDVILMDISMPVMDGLTATKTIRENDGPSAHVPIIAVSANVLPDAVEKFQNAGMNAFVSKPISLDSMRKALQMVATGRFHGFADASGPSPVEDMRRDIGEGAFQKLLERFTQETDSLIEKLRFASWKNEEQAGLMLECHRVAGSCSLFGADDLRDVLIKLEDAIQNAQHDQLTALARRAKGIWSVTQKELERLSRR